MEGLQQSNGRSAQEHPFVKKWLLLLSWFSMQLTEIDAHYRSWFYRIYIVICVFLSSSYVLLWSHTALLIFDTDRGSSVLCLNVAMYGILALVVSGSLAISSSAVVFIRTASTKPFFEYNESYVPEVKYYSIVFSLVSKVILMPLVPLTVLVLFLIPQITSITSYSDESSPSGNWTVNGVNYRLRFATYFSFKCDEGPVFFVLYFAQIFISVFISSCYSSAQMLQIRMAQVLLLELETLKTSLSYLDDRVMSLFCKARAPDAPISKRKELYADEDFQRSAEFCLEENIKHHKRIMEFFERYSKCVSVPAYSAYCTGTVVIAMALITLNSKGEEDKDATFLDGKTVMLLFFLANEVLFMFYLSWIGELIITLGSDLHNEIQFLSIDKYNNKFKRNVLIFLQGTLRDMICKSGGYFDCNMESFGSVMNAAYSFYNVTNASK